MSRSKLSSIESDLIYKILRFKKKKQCFDKTIKLDYSIHGYVLCDISYYLIYSSLPQNKLSMRDKKNSVLIPFCDNATSSFAF